MRQITQKEFSSLRTILLLATITLTGCQTPIQSTEVNAKAVNEKATKDSHSGFVEIYTETTCSTEDCRTLERAIVLDPLVQACLAAAARKNQNSLKVALVGHLNGRGVVSKLHITGSDQDLDTCVSQVLIKKAMATAGPATDFKILIESISTSDPRFGKVKTLPLDIDASHQKDVKIQEKTPVRP